MALAREAAMVAVNRCAYEINIETVSVTLTGDTYR